MLMMGRYEQVGNHVEYPYKEAGRLVKGEISHDDICELVSKTKLIHELYKDLLVKLRQTEGDLVIAQKTVRLLQVSDEQ